MRPPLWFTITLLGAIYFFGLLALVGGVLEARRARRASRWPTAPATVTRLDVVKGGSDGDVYSVEVAYTYAVGGVGHAGARVAFGYDGGRSRETHDALFQKIRGAKTVAARYDPSNPAESCLSHGVHSSVGFSLWFAAGWLLFTVGFTSLVWVFTGRDTALIDNIVVE